MDQARKLVRDLVEAEGATPSRARHEAPNGIAADLDKVLRLGTPREGRREGSAPAQRDWSAALDLVRQAATMVRDGQTQIRQVEVQTREIAQRARDELMAAEARAQAAEARAQAAEARAREAEDWLKRLTDALHEEFSPAQAPARDPA